MKLRALQRIIEKIYRLDSNAPVERFLVSAEELKGLNPGSKDTSPQILLRQGEDETLFLAVHIGDKTLRRIRGKGPNTIRLKDLMEAAEEISHFVYLSWSAANDRPVTLLDVEIQGEIDKFLLARMVRPYEPDLAARLFERFSWKEPMHAEERERYREASRLARKFCASLGRFKNALRRLREFYRLNSQARLALLWGLK
ncbi:MAG: hypothetical protein V1798_06315 [Pseudomonadota bacterium]